VADEDVVQVGEREQGDLDYPFHEIAETGILQLSIHQVQNRGIKGVVGAIAERLESRELDRVWLHIDLDVLDQSVMPAVDSPGSPGFSYDELVFFISGLIETGRVAGADVAIYDPDLDPTGEYAAAIAQALNAAFAPLYRLVHPEVR
jgi:arginase